MDHGSQMYSPGEILSSSENDLFHRSDLSLRSEPNRARGRGRETALDKGMSHRGRGSGFGGGGGDGAAGWGASRGNGGTRDKVDRIGTGDSSSGEISSDDFEPTPVMFTFDVSSDKDQDQESEFGFARGGGGRGRQDRARDRAREKDDRGRRQSGLAPNGVYPTLDDDVHGLGRGRGKHNTIPAWKMESKTTSPTCSPPHPPPPSNLEDGHGLGRGRGKHNTIPAWKMAGKTASKSPSPLKLEDVHGLGRGRGKHNTIPAWKMESKTTSLTCSPPHPPPPSNLEDVHGLGRGRGKHNTIPAWKKSQPDHDRRSPPPSQAQLAWKPSTSAYEGYTDNMFRGKFSSFSKKASLIKKEVWPAILRNSSTPDVLARKIISFALSGQSVESVQQYVNVHDDEKVQVVFEAMREGRSETGIIADCSRRLARATLPYGAEIPIDPYSFVAGDSSQQKPSTEFRLDPNAPRRSFMDFFKNFDIIDVDNPNPDSLKWTSKASDTLAKLDNKNIEIQAKCKVPTQGPLIKTNDRLTWKSSQHTPMRGAVDGCSKNPRSMKICMDDTMEMDPESYAAKLQREAEKEKAEKLKNFQERSEQAPEQVPDQVLEQAANQEFQVEQAPDQEPPPQIRRSRSRDIPSSDNEWRPETPRRINSDTPRMSTRRKTGGYSSRDDERRPETRSRNNSATPRRSYTAAPRRRNSIAKRRRIQPISDSEPEDVEEEVIESGPQTRRSIFDFVENPSRHISEEAIDRLQRFLRGDISVFDRGPTLEYVVDKRLVETGNGDTMIEHYCCIINKTGKWEVKTFYKEPEP